MATKLVVDDGTRAYTIENENGEVICTIHFRPADTSIMDRYNALVEDFDELIKPLAEAGDGDSEANLSVYKAVEAELIDRLNKFLDSKDAGNIFKTRAPLAPVNGTFFYLNVLQGLAGIITDAIKEEHQKSIDRISGYLEDIEEAK